MVLFRKAQLYSSTFLINTFCLFSWCVLRIGWPADIFAPRTAGWGNACHVLS